MQKALAVKKIAYAIRERPILDGVSFRCTENERLCIFGENGAGKSTLLKILCGALEPDSGTIDKQGHIRFVYVPQEFDHAAKALTVAAYIEANAGERLAKRALGYTKQLGFDCAKLGDTICSTLSGGQQKILALACAFAAQPDFLLLDEPENHLDIVSRVELLSLLADFRGGLIFVSHDRLLIDGVATKIGELVRGAMHLSEGSYEDYVEAKMERIGGLQRQVDAATKRINQLSSTIVILRQKAFRGKETAAYHRALKELEDLKEGQQSGRPDDTKTRIKLAGAGRELHKGKLLFRMVDGAFTYAGAKKETFKHANLEMRSGEKIVLLGRNGSGKSTFLKCLTGSLLLSKGEVSWGNGVSSAYFDQHAEFDPEASATRVVADALHVIDTEAQRALGAMKFDAVRMAAKTRELSGGERMRVRFAIVFGARADFVILDEPTNHIDEVTWEILLEACATSKSSILLVTHDYEFIKAFEPSLFWVLQSGAVLPRYKELDVLLEELKTPGKKEKE